MCLVANPQLIFSRSLHFCYLESWCFITFCQSSSRNAFVCRNGFIISFTPTNCAFCWICFVYFCLINVEYIATLPIHDTFGAAFNILMCIGYRHPPIDSLIFAYSFRANRGISAGILSPQIVCCSHLGLSYFWPWMLKISTHAKLDNFPYLLWSKGSVILTVKILFAGSFGVVPPRT